MSAFKLKDCGSFKAVMEIAFGFLGALVEIPKIHYGNSYKRFDKEAWTTEYLCYAGGNESMWTEDRRHFNRNCPGRVFKKPCLVLKEVCWMSPWGIIEGVVIP